MHRDLLIREDDGQAKKVQGYCIATVRTDPRYQRLGFATFLLQKVATWMDGQGGSEASVLYLDVGKASLIRFDMVPTLNGADWPCLLLTTVPRQTRLASSCRLFTYRFFCTQPRYPCAAFGCHPKSTPKQEWDCSSLRTRCVSADGQPSSAGAGRQASRGASHPRPRQLASCSGRVHQRESERHISRDQRINKVTMKEFGSIGFTTSGSSTSPYSGSSCPSRVLASSSRLS
jgi:hypothetical protein